MISEAYRKNRAPEGKSKYGCQLEILCNVQHQLEDEIFQCQAETTEWSVDCWATVGLGVGVITDIDFGLNVGVGREKWAFGRRGEYPLHRP